MDELKRIKREIKMARIVMFLGFLLIILLTYNSYQTGEIRNVQSILSMEDWIGGCIILALYPFGVHVYEKHMKKEMALLVSKLEKQKNEI